jgi:acetyltransferase
MRKLIQHCRARGTRWLVGTVLRENTRMLQLAEELGFDRQGHVAGENTVEVRLDLAAR